MIWETKEELGTLLNLYSRQNSEPVWAFLNLTYEQYRLLLSCTDEYRVSRVVFMEYLGE